MDGREKYAEFDQIIKIDESGGFFSLFIPGRVILFDKRTVNNVSVKKN